MNGGLNLNYSLEYLCFTPESQYLERKSARKKPRELLKTLIGFANADGGVLVIGERMMVELQDLTTLKLIV